MDNSTADKLLTINKETRENSFDSIGKLVSHIEKIQSKSFSYKSGAIIKYCEPLTITNHILFMKKIGALSDDLKPAYNMEFDSGKGFANKLNDNVIAYLKERGLSVEKLSEISSKILSKGKIPTTERMVSEADSGSEATLADINRAFSILEISGQLNLDMCQKLIWLPKGKYEL